MGTSAIRAGNALTRVRDRATEIATGSTDHLENTRMRSRKRLAPLAARGGAERGQRSETVF